MFESIFVQVVVGLFILGQVALNFYFNKKTALLKEEKEEIKNRRKQKIDTNSKFMENILSRLEKTEERYMESLVHLNTVESEWREKHESLFSQYNELKQNLNFIKLFGSTSHLATWVKTVDGRRLNHNKAFELMTGYMIADHINETDNEMVGDVNKTVLEIWDEQHNRVVSSKKPLTDIQPCFHKERPDRIFFVIAEQWPLFLNNQIVAVEGQARHIRPIDKIIHRFKEQNNDSINYQNVLPSYFESSSSNH